MLKCKYNFEELELKSLLFSYGSPEEQINKMH